MIAKDVRMFRTTSAGRLFDTVAALLGFTREITFEGQAAMWLEHLARERPTTRARPYALPLRDGELDYRPLLAASSPTACAVAIPARSRALSTPRWPTRSYARTRDSVRRCRSSPPAASSKTACSLELLARTAGRVALAQPLVPPNDGGLALGQAALATFR